MGREARSLAHHVAAMPAASIAAVKRVVDTTSSSFEQALVDETDAFGALTAAGEHVAPMQRFLQSGGQTRDEGETERAWDERVMPRRRDGRPSG